MSAPDVIPETSAPAQEPEPLDLRIPSEVARDPKLTASDKLLYGVIRALRIRDGAVTIGNPELGLHAALSRRSVVDSLASLEANFWLERVTVRQKRALVPRSPDEQQELARDREAQLKRLFPASGSGSNGARAKSALATGADFALAQGENCPRSGQDLPSVGQDLPPARAKSALFAGERAGAGGSLQYTLSNESVERERAPEKKIEPGPKVAKPTGASDAAAATPTPQVAPPPRPAQIVYPASVSPSYDDPSYSDPGVIFPFTSAAFRARWIEWRQHLLRLNKPLASGSTEQAALRNLDRACRDPQGKLDEDHALAIIDYLMGRGGTPWVTFEPVPRYYNPTSHAPTFRNQPTGTSTGRPAARNGASATRPSRYDAAASHGHTFGRLHRAPDAPAAATPTGT